MVTTSAANVVVDDPAVVGAATVVLVEESTAPTVVVEGEGSASGQRAHTPTARPAIRRPTISHLIIEVELTPMPMLREETRQVPAKTRIVAPVWFG